VGGGDDRGGGLGGGVTTPGDANILGCVNVSERNRAAVSGAG